MNFKRSSFNDDWKFILDKNNDLSILDYDESNMESIIIPHDWSIKQPYNKEIGDGATGYLTGGIGWYRKHFNIDSITDKVIYIHFDGIYNNSEIWINGKKVGKHPYGYSPFYFDISKYLTLGDNVISLKVDRSRYVDSRWYTGSGIYRNVELHVLNKLHFPVWSSFISSSKIDFKKALVDVVMSVKNSYSSDKKFTLILNVLNKSGVVIDQYSEECVIVANEKKNIQITRVLEDHIFWDMDNPYIYSLEYQIVMDGKLLDKNYSTFGLRKCRFDKDLGFFINEKNIKIKGVCLHHDAGLVGAAVPKDVWRRRLMILKDCGCNAIRIAHNPASTEFLDLCDELGLLVQDEFFDEWDNPKDKRLNSNEEHCDYISRGYTEHFQEWAKSDLTNTILSHRNHPSIFQWSIGNEIEWTYPRNVEATGFFGTNANGNYFWNQPPNSIPQIQEALNSLPKETYDIGKTAQKLSNWTKELDTTRPIIANCILPSVSFESGYTDALDIVGFSYRRVMYDYSKKNYPNKICMGTENLGQFHEWKAIQERDFIAGTFLWTGIDYIGEAHRTGWPCKGTPSGLLDVAGFKKPSFYMMKTLWTEKPNIYMVSQTEDKSMFKDIGNGQIIEKEEGKWKTLLWEWHNVNKDWNYNESEHTIVEVYSNCKEVELFLNNTSLGIKSIDDFPDSIYKWSVPYVEGTLKAIGLEKDISVDYSISTSYGVADIAVNLDKTQISANNRDCIHVEIQLIDENGTPVLNSDKEIVFEIDGPCRNLGIDNGSISNVQDHNSNKVVTHEGRALLILQGTNRAGCIKLTVSCGDIKRSIDNIMVEKIGDY